uniref:Uncharacterized protein n=1 Tax=Anguilla anguilla TaxID=7936 RepID=A0A0E9WEK5_ANGAN
MNNSYESGYVWYKAFLFKTVVPACICFILSIRIWDGEFSMAQVKYSLVMTIVFLEKPSLLHPYCVKQRFFTFLPQNGINSVWWTYLSWR